MIDATADKQGIDDLHNGKDSAAHPCERHGASKIAKSAWELSGLHVAVTSDAKNFSVEKAGNAIDLIYDGITGMKLDIKTAE
jgi:hypothetical protein